MAFEEQLRIDCEHENGGVVLRLRGELDLASAPRLRAELAKAEVEATPSLVLDLHELQFMDSTGLRAVLVAEARSRQRGQAFAVTRGSDQVKRLLEITRANEYLRVVDRTEEAI